MFEAIIVAVIQFAVEVIGPVFFSSPIGLFDPPIAQRRFTDRGALVVGLLLVGGAFGWLSVMLFPGRLIDPPKLRLLALALTPPLAGLVATLIAQRRWRHNPLVEPRHYFWYAFCFAFTYSAYRYAYAAKTSH